MTTLKTTTGKARKAARKPAVRAVKRQTVRKPVLRARRAPAKVEVPRRAEEWVRTAVGKGREWAHDATKAGERTLLAGLRAMARAGREVAERRQMLRTRDVARLEVRARNLVKQTGVRTHAWVDAVARGAEKGLIDFEHVLQAQARVAVTRFGAPTRKVLATLQARIERFEHEVKVLAR